LALASAGDEAPLRSAAVWVRFALGGASGLIMELPRLCSIEAGAPRTCEATVRDIKPAPMMAKANIDRDSVVILLSPYL
jgi:hypothetical protein